MPSQPSSATKREKLKRSSFPSSKPSPRRCGSILPGCWEKRPDAAPRSRYNRQPHSAPQDLSDSPAGRHRLRQPYSGGRECGSHPGGAGPHQGGFCPALSRRQHDQRTHPRRRHRLYPSAAGRGQRLNRRGLFIENSATLKRVYKYPDKLVLSPDNPQYEPFVYTGEELSQVRILGKAVGFTSLLD